ncbi:hypothetical protein T07_3926 [Trichinella nelsoni]|uniref:Uncharacterized protein n=1 Tax=Trichinella nelsoni TaxID=6336 RepID=A0A0V0RJN5_9BILA|nr:hypothetical protein T07_3926 [Trichinella nelsoni]
MGKLTLIELWTLREHLNGWARKRHSDKDVELYQAGDRHPKAVHVLRFSSSIRMCVTLDNMAFKYSSRHAAILLS